MLSSVAAMLATGVLAIGMGFQLLLAVGMPWGRAAWGGKHSGVLPVSLRLGSLVAAGMLAVAAWVVLARVGLVAGGSGSAFVKVAPWVFAGLFGLNTLGNLASQSRVERLVMTPQTVVLTICFLTVAWIS